MIKKIALLLASFLLAYANTVWAADEKPPVTAKALIRMVVSNLIPPPGYAFSAAGTFHTSAENSDMCLQRAVRNISEEGVEEAFQTQFNSPTGSVGGVERPGLRYRGIRWRAGGSVGVHASTFPPTLGRGRKLSWVPNNGILGGDLGFYNLHPVSVFDGDFVYRLMVWDMNHPILDGIRLPGLSNAVSPYGSSRITLQRVSITYVPMKVEYWENVNDSHVGHPDVVVEYADYKEVVGADGYWAPHVVSSGSTRIMFSSWRVIELPANIFTRNHALLGTQNISCAPTTSQN